MKIKESITFDDNAEQMIVKQTHNLDPILKKAKEIRDSGAIGMFGEKSIMADTRLIGVIPTALIGAWIKEAGITWEDNHAVQEVVKKKILSGEFDKFRSDWKGTY